MFYSIMCLHFGYCVFLNIGEEYEMYRIGKMTGGPGDEVITRAPKHKSIGSLLLAHKWTESVNPVGMFTIS